MRIVILTTGSRGDVQPYVALAAGLQAAGHPVRVATHADFAPLARERGLDFFRLADSSRHWHATAAGGDMIHSNGDPLAFARHFVRMREPLMSELMARSCEAAHGADLVIGSPTTIGIAYSVAEKHGVSLMPAYYLPMAPSRSLPSCFAPEPPGWLPGRGLFNFLSHFVLSGYLWQLLRPSYNRARQDVLGLPPLPLWGPPLRVFRNIPALHGYSPLVVPRPAEWGANHAVTGFWFLDTAAHWRAPARLLDFLASGPPPVCVGFGSMHSRGAERMTELAVEALRRCRVRGILLTGWGGLGAGRAADDVYVTEAVPHDWLLPRTAAVIHHGGAGTTAAAVRAGVPSVVIPFMADQPFWGRRVHALGVGPPPIPCRELTAGRLAAALRTALECPQTRRRAAWLGARVREEDGVARAVEAVEMFYPRADRRAHAPARAERVLHKIG